MEKNNLYGNNLYGKEYILFQNYTTESLCSTPETNTTLSINYISMKKSCQIMNILHFASSDIKILRISLEHKAFYNRILKMMKLSAF